MEFMATLIIMLGAKTNSSTC